MSAPDDWKTHWERYALSAEENPAQRLRRELIFARLDLSHGPTRVVDLGSGQGDFAQALHVRCPSAAILGVDVSQSGLAVARRKVPGARFVERDLLMDVAADPADAGWATHAVCSEVLEHVDNPTRLLFNAGAYLMPGGALVVTVPGGPMSAFDRHIGHRRHFSPATLRQVLEAAGYAVDNVTRAGFPFFNLYRLVVMARGKRLIQDVTGPPSPPARAVLQAFHGLFRFNLPGASLGWQLVATAHKPRLP